MWFFPLLAAACLFSASCSCGNGTSTTTIPPTTGTTLTTTTEGTTTTKTSTTTTTTEITTTTTEGATTTTVTNPSFWRDEWPDLDEGLIVNVKHFGAVGDGVHDDGPPIQNAIDFAAGEKSLVQVAPADLSPTWREYYQFWEDAKKAQETGMWFLLEPHLD